MLKIKNLNKFYGDKQVLKDVHIDIPDKQFISIIGPNGSGKSTLINCITGLIEYEGNIYLEDTNIKKYPKKELAKEISLLKQNSYYDLKITIKELVSFGRFPYSSGNLTKEDEDIVDEIINFLNLTHLQDSYINNVSGGERQRAYIAMMLAQDTNYMILDEPLNNLDMRNSKQIMTLLKKFVEERNKTILLIVHDINFASLYSDKIMAIKEGSIVEYDDTDKVITEEKLKNIYDTDIKITQTDIGILCNYYR